MNVFPWYIQLRLPCLIINMIGNNLHFFEILLYRKLSTVQYENYASVFCYDNLLMEPKEVKSEMKMYTLQVHLGSFPILICYKNL